MNWADYAIIAILLLSVVTGLWKGLVSEVLALIIWAIAFWVAWLLGPVVADYFRHYIDTPSIRIIASYALCFIVVLMLGGLVKSLIGRLISSTGLSGNDRLLGMIFGLLRGVFLVVLIVFLLGFTPFTRDQWWQQSRLLPAFSSTVEWLGHHVPANVRYYLDSARSFMPDESRHGEQLPVLNKAREGVAVDKPSQQHENLSTD